MHNKISKAPSLSIADFARIQELFKTKKWPIDDAFNDHIFENFCNMMSCYDKEQHELIFSLTKNFLWVQESEYIKYFDETLQTFASNFSFERGKNIFFCPLLPEDDFGKTKSSVMLLYIIKAHMTVIRRKYSQYNIKYADSPNLVDLSSINDNYTLCLIDDFIGTGETAISAVNYFERNGINKDKIVILSLVGMEDGLLQIVENGCCVYTDIICEKGITKHGNDEQIRIMKSIEEKIKVKEKFRFGYGASEALVKMMRTPNNTFPVYWLRKNNKFAPFPR